MGRHLLKPNVVICYGNLNLLKALIMDLAPEDRKAGMFGLYYLLRDLIVSVAAFGGAFLWQIDPVINFLVPFHAVLWVQSALHCEGVTSQETAQPDASPFNSP